MCTRLLIHLVSVEVLVIGFHLLVGFRCVKIVRGLELGLEDVAEGCVEPDGVEPGDPRQRDAPDVVDGLPGSEALNQLALVEVVDLEVVDRLGQSVSYKSPAGPMDGTPPISAMRAP
jgi:hypothetical protein